MLKIIALDRTAEARIKIVTNIQSHLQSDEAESALLPRIDLKPLSPQEIKFHAAPDILFVGHELLRNEPGQLAALRKLLPHAVIIVYASRESATLSQVENMARLGADDVVSDEISSHDFLRKLIMLTRKARLARSGKLILIDSAKGGVGSTTVSAALAEALVDAGKRVLLVDLDFESQDLSRFMRARPYINENLALLLEQQRPVTQEFVEQSVIQVWHDEPNLLCLPPAPDHDGLHTSTGSYARIFINVLTVLDSLYDIIVVDVARARGAMLQTLYRVADKVVLLLGNDPAALFSTVDRVNRMRSFLPPDASLHVLCNSILSRGLEPQTLRHEFLSATKLPYEAWLPCALPFCVSGQRWPASGGTFYSQARPQAAQALNEIIIRLDLVEGELEVKSLSTWQRFIAAASKIDLFGRINGAAVGTEFNVRDALLEDQGRVLLEDASADRKLISFNPNQDAHDLMIASNQPKSGLRNSITTVRAESLVSAPIENGSQLMDSETFSSEILNSETFNSDQQLISHSIVSDSIVNDNVISDSVDPLITQPDVNVA